MSIQTRGFDMKKVAIEVTVACGTVRDAYACVNYKTAAMVVKYVRARGEDVISVRSRFEQHA
jgi:hypothetical protein